ncbi:hypothetical protein [Sciscionella marina]|uniref:hypothetical protein n=1 Tax=Sciscionella marina TaxID=508770 RepID=UPI0003645547|nr:hypothetical protein [Sciscionella marina]
MSTTRSISAEGSQVTEEYPVRPARANPPGIAGRILAWFSGAAAAALVLLALVLLGAVVVTALDDRPGPLAGTVVVHVLAALVTVVLQRFADRYPGRVRVLCSWAVLVIFVVVLALYWWF